MKQLMFAVRLIAFAAFVVFGIVWSSDQNETIAVLWAISFGVTALLAVAADVPAEKRRSPAQLWAAVPGPSKDPADYR
jgi:hypothetical protein